MATQIQIKRGTTTPSGLTVGEKAVNTSTNQIYIGGTGGTVWVGGEVTAGVDMGAGSAVSATRVPTQSGVYNYVRNNFVTSFNGATGAVTGASLGANTFTGRQDITSGGLGVLGGIFAVDYSAGITLAGRYVSIGERFGTTGTYFAIDNSAGNIVANTGIYAFSHQGTGGIIASHSVLAPVIEATSYLKLPGQTAASVVTSFNGAIGAVTGASLGANTFTGTQTLTAGLTTSYLYASTGSTFGSTLQVNGGATFSGRVDVGGNFKVLGDTQLGDASTDTLNVYSGTTFQNRTDFGGSNNFNSGLTAAGNINLSGTRSITGKGASLTIKGISTGASPVASNSIVLSGQVTTNLSLNSATGIVDIQKGQETVLGPYIGGLKIKSDDNDTLSGSSTITPQTYLTADRFLYVPDDTGTIALTKNVVSSFNGATGAVTGASLGANTFTGLQTLTAGLCADGGITFNGAVTGATATFTRRLTASGGISASGGMTLDGGKVWHSLNDGPTSGLDAGQLYGVTAALYASSLSTGLEYGGLITINAGNSAAFDVTAGAGYIVTTGATYTSGPTPVITRVSWTAKTGVTLSGLTAQDTTWIYFDSSGNLNQQSEFFTDDQVQSSIAVGALVHPSRAYISLAKSIPNVSYATDKQYEQFIRAFGPLKVSGHTIQANGANLKLNRTSGTAFILGRNYPNDPNNPSVVSDNAQTDCTFWRYYRGATAGSFVTVLNQTAIDPENYDDGTGTLNTVPSNKPFTIQRLFFFPNTPSVLGVYYGRGIYASMAEAANNVTFEDFTEITNTATNAVFAGYLLVKKGTTNLTTAIAADDARIIQSGQFRSTTSGGGTIATNLDSLNDVTITSVQDDDLLIYDTATSQWLNTPLKHIGVSSVNGLTGALTAVASFNGVTGAVTGVCAAVAGTGISVSGSTGTVTITNTGVRSFGGLTGTVGITAGSNITITQSGNTFTISAAAASSGATATYAVTTSSNINATRYLTFVTGACANGASLFVDDVTGPLSYQPSTSTLTVTSVTAPGSVGTNTTAYIGSSLNVDSIGGNGAGVVIEGGGGNVTVSDGALGSVFVDAVDVKLGDYSAQSGGYYVTIGNGQTDFANMSLTGIGVGSALVQTFNGRTGAVQGVSAAVAGTGISVSGATGSVTITNTGVQSFNGSTGAVQGVSRVNGFTAGITFAAGSGITFTASGGTITLSTTGGGFTRTIVTTGVSASAGSAASTDYVYIGTTSGNINITLPTAVSNTNRYTVKQSSTGTITILTTSSQTMDGVTAYNLNKQYQAVDFISDNANWHIL